MQNIELTLNDRHVEQITKAIELKIKEKFADKLPTVVIDYLPDYIVKMIMNGRKASFVVEKLEEMLDGQDATEFCGWLWEEIIRTANVPVHNQIVPPQTNTPSRENLVAKAKFIIKSAESRAQSLKNAEKRDNTILVESMQSSDDESSQKRMRSTNASIDELLHHYEELNRKNPNVYPNYISGTVFRATIPPKKGSVFWIIDEEDVKSIRFTM